MHHPSFVAPSPVAPSPVAPRRSPPWRALRTVAFALVVATASLAAAQSSLAVVDDLGRTVTLAAPALRVVSMVPSHTETVCALHRCERLVGRDTFSNYPPEVTALPDLGSAFAPDLEALVALEPDLVLVDEYSGLAAFLAPLGIAVYAGTPQRLEEVFVLFERLGRLLGADDGAILLTARVEERLREVAARVEGAAAPRVYYEIDATPYSVGPEGFIGSLITMAGGANIVPVELGEFPLLDPEYVVAADPDRIVLADAPYGESLATLRTRPGWGGLRAVVEGRVTELSSEEVDMLSRAGPRLGDAVALLARLFHPGRF